MWQNEKGYIVVETIICFLLFVLMNFSIVSLINVVAVQARVHYALTQAAETLSMYCYTLDLVGAAPHLQNMAGRSGRVEGEINAFKGDLSAVLSGIENLASGEVDGKTLDEIGEHGEALADRAADWGENFSEDPKDMVQNLMNYGLQQGQNQIFGAMVRPLIGRYLNNGQQSGDEFLRDFGVVGGLEGIDFATFSTFDLGNTRADDSMLLTEDGDVKIIVQYEIDYTFGALPLPFKNLKVTQEVTTRAWLSGKGEGYTP